MGLDRAEVRRRNLVPAASDAVHQAARRARRHRRRARQRRLSALPGAGARTRRLGGVSRRGSRRRAREGRHLGIGLANFVKGTGRGPFESVTVRIGPSGKIQVSTGAAAMGQGTKTMLAQIVADALGARRATSR